MGWLILRSVWLLWMEEYSWLRYERPFICTVVGHGTASGSRCQSLERILPTGRFQPLGPYHQPGRVFNSWMSILDDPRSSEEKYLGKDVCRWKQYCCYLTKGVGRGTLDAWDLQATTISRAYSASRAYLALEIDLSLIHQSVSSLHWGCLVLTIRSTSEV